MKAIPLLLITALLPLHAEPAADAPRLQIPGQNILSTRTLHQGGRRITVQKVAPIQLPRVAKPSATPKQKPTFLPQEIDAKPHRVVQLGGNVYYPKQQPDQAHTVLQYWQRPHEKPVILLANANFLWLTGFGEYESESTRYSLLMMITPSGISRADDIKTLFEKEFPGKLFPTFPDPGKASLIIVEGNPTEEELAPIQSLIDLYNTDKTRLRAAFEQTQRDSLEHARQRVANPPEKKNLIIRYARIDAIGQAQEKGTAR